MKLMWNIVFIQLNPDEMLMINTLNGLMNIIDTSAYKTIQSWRKLEVISPKNRIEQDLYNALKSRGHLIAENADELNQKYSLLSTLERQAKESRYSYSTLAFILTYGCNFPLAFLSLLKN